MKGYYSLGLVGYEVEPIDEETVLVTYTGEEDPKPKRYKIQYTDGRPFVRPYGRRIYLDQCLRVDL